MIKFINFKLLISSFVLIVIFILLSAAVIADECDLTINKTLIYGDTIVPLFTELDWTLNITVTNNGDDTQTNAVVNDVIPGEFNVTSTDPSKGSISITPKGKSSHINWTVGDLAPDESAILLINISTKENPPGKQEFTSCGNYSLNSGATAESDDCGAGPTGSIEVEAPCEDPCAGNEPPVITILTPPDGFTLVDPLVISWNFTDPDDDNITIYGFYSTDDWESWTALFAQNAELGDSDAGKGAFNWEDHGISAYDLLSIILIATDSPEPGVICHAIPDDISNINPVTDSRSDITTGTPIPEFSTIGIILGLLAVAIIYLLMIRKKH